MKNRNRLQLTPKTKQTVSLKTKLILGFVGAGILLAAALLTKAGFSGVYNGNNIKINSNVAHRYNMDVTNGEKGTLVVEGILKFHKDLVNEGTINCGTCTSGAIHFDDTSGSNQTIEGPEKMTFYDVVFNNPNGIDLKGDLQAFNSVSFTQGMVTGSYTNPDLILHFLNDAAHIGASDASHVDGYVSKTGVDQFEFPVGDGTTYHPTGITGGAGSTDVFKAAYFPGDPSVATAPSGAPFDVTQVELGIEKVNTTEFWDIDGVVPTQIVLYWNPSHNMNTFATSQDNLVVVGWDGTKWVNLGQSNISGPLNQSGIITSAYATPSNYSAFTFGKKDLKALPVEWMSFDGKQIENFVMLEWSTVWETNTWQFDIERSVDGSFFTKVGKLEAAGSTQEPTFYEFPDREPFPDGSASMYYRLKQVDLTGNYNFSNIIEVSMRDLKTPNKIKIFPNPTQDGLTVKYQVYDEMPAVVTVTSMTGQTVSREQVSGEGNLKLQTQNWAIGNYVVALVTEQQTVSKMAILLK